VKEESRPLEHLLSEMLAMQLYANHKKPADTHWIRLPEPERAIFRSMALHVANGTPYSAYRSFREAMRARSRRDETEA
jgi:hypothetical protein